MRRVLVTGGAGFIGSNFIQYLLARKNDIMVVNLDALTYAGNLDNLKEVETDPRYFFVHGDIRDKELLERLFSEYEFDAVVNFAAESHVDRSIDAPAVFLSTNVMGTQNLLETAKKYWKLEPENNHSRAYKKGVRFLQISTDEVYGSLGRTGAFTEDSPLAPSSPYSASKASADMMVRAYYKTYGLPVNITRCSNNYGPRQFPEKLIPMMIGSTLENKPLTVYGDGNQIRDWIHVLDHCAGILRVLEDGRVGEVYNIGANQERSNLEIIHMILQELGKPESLIVHVKDRPGHDFRYAIDSTKITEELSWKPECPFEEGLRETIGWYLSYQQ